MMNHSFPVDLPTSSNHFPGEEEEVGGDGMVGMISGSATAACNIHFTLCPELGYSQIWWLIIIFVPRKNNVMYWYAYNICNGHDFQRTPSRAQLLQLHIGLLVEWFSPNLLTKPRFQSGRPSPEHWLSFGSHFSGPMKRGHDCGGGIV